MRVRSDLRLLEQIDLEKQKKKYSSQKKCSADQTIHLLMDNSIHTYPFIGGKREMRIIFFHTKG